MRTEHVPVLVIGGGMSGLSAGTFLSRRGVDFLLVNEHHSTSPYPKAHIVHQRTMEILDELGIADEIYEHSTPSEGMRAAGWFLGLAGDHPLWGQELGRVEAWGAGYSDPEYIASSAMRSANIPQMRLEPILKRRLDQLAGCDQVRFGHRVVDLNATDHLVTATVFNRDSGETYQVTADYLMACDGGRFVGERLGVQTVSRGLNVRMVSIHFEGDLSDHATGADVLTRFLVNPDLGGSWAGGTLIPEGPHQWGHLSEEWLFHLKNPDQSGAPVDDEAVLAHMRRALGLPDFHPKIHRISEWLMEGVVAERFRCGRAFLLGDSAHRHPPTGGLGLNAGVQDAYNLAWKLDLVLAGRAGDSLLDTFETERRPVVENNVTRAIENSQGHYAIDAALGISAEQTREENWRKLELLSEDSEEGVAARRRLSRAIASNRIGFRHHNVEFGYAYSAGALVDDGTPTPTPVEPVLLYQPSTRPGHPLPHAFVQDIGEPLPLGSLVANEFLLIAGEDGQAWVSAAERVGVELGVTVRALRVGVWEGDYLDTRAAWAAQRGFGRDGAILVRPDRYVGFRSDGPVSDPASVLRQVLSQILSLDDAGSTTTTASSRTVPV